MLKNIKKWQKALPVLVLILLMASFGFVTPTLGASALDIQPLQDPGAGGFCREHTTGGGCFNSSIMNHVIHASHSNPTRIHNVTAANSMHQSPSLWRNPSSTGSAQANITASGSGNSSWWNVR